MSEQRKIIHDDNNGLEKTEELMLLWGNHMGG